MKLFQFCNKSVVPEELVQYNHNNFMEVQYDEEDVYDLLSVPFYHHNNDTFKFQNRKVKTKCPISKDNSDDHDYVQTQRFSKKSCFSSMQNFKKSVKCNKPKYHAEYSSKIGTSSDGGTCRKKKRYISRWIEVTMNNLINFVMINHIPHTNIHDKAIGQMN